MEFVDLFLPIVENEEITGTMRCDGDNDPVSEFIGKYYFILFNISILYFQVLFVFFFSALQRHDNITF